MPVDYRPCSYCTTGANECNGSGNGNSQAYGAGPPDTVYQPTEAPEGQFRVETGVKFIGYKADL